MAKKKSEIKQNQKQTINITIGDRAVKRKRRGRPRKRQPTGGFAVQHTFTAPIINYPPNYVNPAVVQPLQQPEAVSLVPKAPAGPAPAKQPRLYSTSFSRGTLTDFPEGETAPALGLDPTKPVKLKVEKEEKQRPISAFSTFDRRLAEASQRAKAEKLSARLFRKSLKSQPDNTLGGRDTNLGDAVELDTPPSRVFNTRTKLPPIGQPLAQGVWVPPGEAKPRTPQPRRRRPEGLRPPDYPPPSELSPAIAVRLKKDGTPDKRYLKKAQREEEGPVEPFGPPPEEAQLVPPSGQGLRYLGSSRAPAEAPPPSIERQREQAITAEEQANFV